MKPLILINFKTYPESLGNKSLLLAKSIASVKNKNYLIAIAPSLVTLREIAKKVRIPVYAQHADNDSSGAHTGHVLPSEIKDSDAVGVILNHSEKKISQNILEKTIEACKKEKLDIIVCASSLSEIEDIAKLKPDYLAYEPKELIGGNLSVTKARPEIISKAVQAVKKISPKTKILVGAGIHTKNDLHKALELGAEGVLMAHAVVKAKDPKKFLEEFLN